jgi:hypothetical protein
LKVNILLIDIHLRNIADAGVPEWGKVMHMRKAATTFLTAQEGLAPNIV